MGRPRTKSAELGPKAGNESSALLDRDGMISKKELAVFLDVPESTLDHWVSRGLGPDVHVIGNHRKYWPADVRAWLKTCKRNVASHADSDAA